MKQKKIFFMMVLVMVAILSFIIIPSTANATANIPVAQIKQIGTILSGGVAKIVVKIADGSATPQFTGDRQYFLHPDLGNQALATLLTAFSMDKTVWLRVESLDALSLITIIYCDQ